MDRKVILLRFCYWLGALLDGRAALRLSWLLYRGLPREIHALNSPQELAMDALWGAGDGAALMWGWTFLLLWASRKPMERRAVLLLTVIPVILVLILNLCEQMSGGFADFGQISGHFCFLIALGALFAFSHFYASKGARDCR